MGCDIHLFVEARKSAEEPWELVAIKSQCDWCEGKRVTKGGEQCYGCKGSGERVGFSSRNYDTFAILANVRNGSGVAGCDTGDGFEPISEPRGLPEDMSAELRAIQADDGESDARSDAYKLAYGCRWLGDHSFSHLLLNELMSCNWNRRTNQRGVLKPESFREFQEKGAPDSWSGGMSGPGVVHVTNVEMAELLEHAEFSGDAHFPRLVAISPECTVRHAPIGSIVVTEAQWSVSYKESSQTFYTRFLPAMCHFATRNGISQTDMRIVFGFDS